MPDDDRQFQVPQDRIAAELFEGEAIIIDLREGTYYSLTGAAADVWALLGAGRNVAEVGGALASRYAIDVVRASADAARLATQLEQAGLLEPGGGLDADVSELALPTEAYATPELVTYTDMQDLLALDPPMPGLSGMPWQGKG